MGVTSKILNWLLKEKVSRVFSGFKMRELTRRKKNIKKKKEKEKKKKKRRRRRRKKRKTKEYKKAKKVGMRIIFQNRRSTTNLHDDDECEKGSLQRQEKLLVGPGLWH